MTAVIIIVCILVFLGIHCLWINSVNCKVKEELEKKNEEIAAKSAFAIKQTNKEIADGKIQAEQEIKRKYQEQANEFEKQKLYLLELKKEFEKSYIDGRKWLSQYISEAYKTSDKNVLEYLKNKTRPAGKNTRDIVKEVQEERREAVKKLKLLEYQLKSYEEYFPFIEEFKDIILNEDIKLNFKSSDEAQKNLDEIDSVRKWLSKEEYERLSETERNQLALDKYINKNKTNWEIGRFYERYLGYMYESDGWDVDFIGAIKGLEDMGRDLVCKKDDKIVIVQAKCWSFDKIIHEKHIFQLFGTTLCYALENKLPITGNSNRPMGIFISTAKLSPLAQESAKLLGITVKHNMPLVKSYPMIKCNINQGNKIYHLPIDQQYDRVKIIKNTGEVYVKTVAEAEKLGFRRAYKHNFHSK